MPIQSISVCGPEAPIQSRIDREAVPRSGGSSVDAVGNLRNRIRPNAAVNGRGTLGMWEMPQSQDALCGCIKLLGPWNNV